MQNRGSKSAIFRNLGAKLKFWAAIIFPVGNLQLSVGKLEASCPPFTFLTHSAAFYVPVRKN